ncbi:MAG: phage tail protein [Acidobacteriaceae bacterium]|jgi:microcystin-dependent protein|nr:phage tail protein [Acidobacteriaceae bacterium]
MDAFIGQIVPVAFNFEPQGWYLCRGQIMSISSNTALFSLLGTTYGGNGQTTFALPDLRGRVPISYGAGPGLTGRNHGERGGSETVTLTTKELPAHTHTLEAGRLDPDADFAASEGISLPSGLIGGAEAASATGSTPVGGGIGHPNTPPYLAVNWIICAQGIYPPRS